MKRFCFVFLMFIGVSIIGNAEPYKPYPILLVHGIASNSGTWGAPTILRSDSIPEDSIKSGHTYDHFLDYMTKYAWAWYDWEKEQGLKPTYTPSDTQVRFPNKTFLEVVNMDDPWGSVDDDYSEFWPFTGRGYESSEYSSWVDELHNRVVEVLEEYYGDGWDDSSDAKIIFVAHSGGGMVVR